MILKYYTLKISFIENNIKLGGFIMRQNIDKSSFEDNVEEAVEAAKTAIKMGMDDNLISKITKLTVIEVKRIREALDRIGRII